MKKKNKIILWSLVGAVILAGVTAGGYYGYGKWRVYSYKRNIKEPYVRDARASLGGDTPLEAYTGFRRALEEGDRERAVQYVFLSEREEYERDLEEEEMVNNYLDMPPAKELRNESESDCAREAFACEEKAEFYYEYEVEEPREIEIWGQQSTIEPGKHTQRVTFIKNLNGEWQIGSL